MQNATSIPDETQRSAEIEGMNRIHAMILNSKGWPLADGGLGRQSRTESIAYYESIFGPAYIAPPVALKIPRPSAHDFSSDEKMKTFLASSMKQLAGAETAEQRESAAHSIDEALRHSKKFMAFVEDVAQNAETQLRTNAAGAANGAFGELLLSLAVKNAKDWPMAMGSSDIKSRRSEMETYTTIFAPISSNILAGRGLGTGYVEYGSVVLQGAWALGVDRKNPLDESEELIFSSDAAMTKEQFDLKWQNARNVAMTGVYRARTLRYEAQRLERVEKQAEEDKEERFLRACRKRDEARSLRPARRAWIRPVAMEEDMPAGVLWIVADPAYHPNFEAMARLFFL